MPIAFNRTTPVNVVPRACENIGLLGPKGGGQCYTTKTIKIGAKTQVLKSGPDTPASDALPSDEEIRKITGA